MMKFLHKFFSKNSKTIKFIFYLVFVTLATTFVISPWMYNNMEFVRTYFREWRAFFGQASVVLLLLSMTPGIMKRFDWRNEIETILLLFRREIGILAFYTTLIHVGFASWTRKIASGDTDFVSYFDRQLEGSIAFILFFILLVISNDYSMRILKKWWKYIQRLAYVAAVLILLHVLAVTGSRWVIYLIEAYLVIEVISWGWFWFKASKKAPVTDGQN